MATSPNQFDLTIVVPTYNEADIIEGSLRKVAESIGDVRSRTEVIIADDGWDELPSVIDRIGASFGFAHIVVMRNPKPLGKGRSIERAMHVSRGTIVGFIDIDLSVAPLYIVPAMKDIHGGSDICIASRQGDRFKTDGSLVTSILATIFRIIHKNLIFGRGKSISDTQCGFKFFKNEIAKDLYQELVASDGLTDLEILVKAIQRGHVISELKVPRINDRVGKRKLSRVIWGESVSLWNIFRKYRLGL